MEDINVLEINNYSIIKVDYSTIAQIDNENVGLFVEDSFVNKKIESNKGEVILRRKVFFEPEHMFYINIYVLINFERANSEKRSLKSIDEEIINEDLRFNISPIFNRISMIISSITSQTLGLPLITPPNFVDEKLEI